MKKCIVLISIFLFCSCTIVKYEANDKKFSWTSTKKVLISIEKDKFNLETDPDSQLKLIENLANIAKEAK